MRCLIILFSANRRSHLTSEKTAGLVLVRRDIPGIGFENLSRAR